MGRRTVILIVAVLIAALGTALVWLYVRNLGQEEVEGQELVPVLVAQTPIEAGTSGDAAQQAAAFTTIQIPREQLADGALSDPSTILDQVALVPIYPNEQILQQKFGTPGQQASFIIPEGKIAASFQFSDPARVAGLVRPSSEVAIFVTTSAPEGTDVGGPGGGDVGAGQNFTQLVLPRIEVLAAGQTTVISQTTTDAQGQETTEQIPLAILTLALTQQEAQKIIFAQSQGELYLGLLTEDSEVEIGEPISIENLFVE